MLFIAPEMRGSAHCDHYSIVSGVATLDSLQIWFSKISSSHLAQEMDTLNVIENVTLWVRFSMLNRRKRLNSKRPKQAFPSKNCRRQARDD